MGAYDLQSNIKIVNAVNAAAVTDSSATSEAIDTAGFESFTAVAQMSAFTSGAGKISLLESEEESGTYTVVAQEDLINIPEEMKSAGAVSKVGYRGHKRFLKVKIEKVTAMSATVGAIVILGNPHHSPAA